MRWVVFGAGGVGGYFGGRLARAGEDVTFIARGRHLEALRNPGLRVRSGLGDFTVSPVAASDDPSKLEPGPDAVLVTVKSWQLPDAARAVRLLAGPSTVVLPLLNGVEATAVLARECGAEHVLKGLAMIIAYISAPGEITHVGGTPMVVFGEPDGRPRERVTWLRDAFVGSGVKVDLPADMDVALWRKFLFVASFGGVGAVTRAPAGVIRRLPETRALLERAMREIAAVARSRGVALEDEAVKAALGLIDTLPAEATASLQRDLAAGRRSELDDWSGAVVRLGRVQGVPTPVHEFVYHAMLPLELKAQGEVEFG